MPRSWIDRIAVYVELVETLGCLLVGGMDARVRGSQSKSQLARGGQSRLLLRKAWATRSRGTRGQPHPTPIQGSTSRLRSINSPGHYQSTSGRVNFAPTSPPRDRIWCSQDDDRSGSALGMSRLDQSRASVQKNSRRYRSESLVRLPAEGFPRFQARQATKKVRRGHAVMHRGRVTQARKDQGDWCVTQKHRVCAERKETI